jgi:SAM-dependent methyltransferase
MKICTACAARYDSEAWICPTCSASPAAVDGVPSFRGMARGAAPTADATYRRDDLMAAEQWHFWFQARRRLVLWAIGRLSDGTGSLLDVGCGTGFVLEGIRARFPRMDLSGCDAAPDALLFASRRVPGAFVFQAGAAGLPFEEEFAVITALDVIEHIDDDREALRAMYLALRPGGGLVLTVPQHPALWSPVDEFSSHRRRYTRSDLTSKVRGAGFELVRCTSCFTTTLPMVAASRLRRRGRACDPLAEFRIPRPLNRLLDGLMECEWQLIKWGVSLPAGGSLLLAARRPQP